MQTTTLSVFYCLMLRSRPEQLKLCVSGSKSVDEKFATKRERVELVRDAQAFELDGDVNGHENVVPVPIKTR